LSLTVKKKEPHRKTGYINTALPLRREILNKKDNGKIFDSGNRVNEKRRKTHER
jgi:hypothetical protein